MSKKKSNKNNSKNIKKSNKLRITFIIIALIFLIISIRFYKSIIHLNMLPTNYAVAFLGVLAIISIALILALVKKHKTLKLNIFCLILIVIMSFGYTFANHYIDITIKFLSKMFTEIAEVENYYVIVNRNSQYNKIEDIVEKDIYTFLLEDDVRNKIQEKVHKEIKIKDDIIGLGNELLENKIDALLLSSSQYDLLSEDIENFKDNTKIILTETHKIEVQDSIEDANTKYNIKNGSFNIYISGIDIYGNINNVARSDANILVTVNLDTHEILLTSIPRDYYVTLHSKRAKDKLTHSGIYGITETVTTVEDFLGIDINYYARVNFSTVIKLVDTLGGVDVYSDYSFNTIDEKYIRYTFKKGNNHLNGAAALAFSRERNSFKEGDNQRIKNQQKVIEAIINKVMNSKTILTKYSDILNAMTGSFNTNIDQKEISDIVKKQLQKMPQWTIKTISLDGNAATRETYSMGNQLLYVTIPDDKSVNDAKEEIKRVMGKQ